METARLEIPDKLVWVFEGVASFNLLCFHKSAEITIDLEEVRDFIWHPFNEQKEQAA